ncbi:hypothetical protein HBB16_12955 [Pseudonocardia sp. MCCB 268]|nr:hypothetical protein [Pseudonocardia cytotoxica]
MRVPGRGRPPVRRDQTRRAARGLADRGSHQPGGAAAADRGRDRRVQFLFTGRDAVSAETAALLEDVARRSRSGACTWCWPAGTSPGSTRSGAVSDLRAVRAADQRCRGPADTRPGRQRRRWAAALARDRQPTTPVWSGSQVVKVPEAGAALVRDVQRVAFVLPDEPRPVVFDGAPRHARQRSGPAPRSTAYRRRS